MKSHYFNRNEWKLEFPFLAIFHSNATNWSWKLHSMVEGRRGGEGGKTGKFSLACVHLTLKSSFCNWKLCAVCKSFVCHFFSQLFITISTLILGFHQHSLWTTMKQEKRRSDKERPQNSFFPIPLSQWKYLFLVFLYFPFFFSSQFTIHFFTQQKKKAHSLSEQKNPVSNLFFRLFLSRLQWILRSGSEMFLFITRVWNREPERVASVSAELWWGKAESNPNEIFSMKNAQQSGIRGFVADNDWDDFTMLFHRSAASIRLCLTALALADSRRACWIESNGKKGDKNE